MDVKCYISQIINAVKLLIQIIYYRGITEYLFRNQVMLDDAINAALYRKDIRPDDMEFVTCARGWAESVSLGSMEGYRKRFEETAGFFKDQFAESTVVGNRMIAMITKNTSK